MTFKEMRKKSGSVTDNRPLVSFLYELLRDHMPAGDVEIMLRHVEQEIPNLPVRFTNGYLAKYAKLLADRLTVKVRKQR